MDFTYIQQMTVQEFTNLLDERLTLALTKNQPQNEQLHNGTNLVTINDLVRILGVTKPTIYNWKKKGLITDQRIGGKVYYDLDAIYKSLKENKKDFSKGRDYLYTRADKMDSYAISEKKYFKLRNKYLNIDDKFIPDDDLKFLNEFKENYCDQNGFVRKNNIRMTY